MKKVAPSWKLIPSCVDHRTPEHRLACARGATGHRHHGIGRPGWQRAGETEEADIAGEIAAVELQAEVGRGRCG